MNLTYSNSIKKHTINYNFKVLIINRPTWFPYNFTFDIISNNFFSKNPDGLFLFTSVNGINNDKSSSLNILYTLKNLFSLSFFFSFCKLLYNILKLQFSFMDSNCLDKLRINNVLVGDIIVAEYLRNKKHGNGILKFDLRFHIVCLKYLVFFQNFESSLNKLLKNFSNDEIRFSFQETSFTDEFLRRILINKKIFYEFVFDKYSEKFKLFEYNVSSLGRANEYTPKNIKISNNTILEMKQNMDRRFSDGIQFWTGNITDVNTQLKFDIDSSSSLDNNKPIAILYLHAVADDQFRCGFDCFKSIDDFHHFTINSLLNLGYQCILKPHPGIVSPIHPDKSLIDYRYVSNLYQHYGLDYNSSINNFDNLINESLNHKNVFAINPRLSLNAISKKINFIVLTHHGNVTFESLHLKIPNLKYKYCKSREFDFCNTWSNKLEYNKLLKYYKTHKTLPKKHFKDDFYEIVAILSKKKNSLDYNKIFFNSHNEFFNTNEIKSKVNNISELNSNIDLIKFSLERNPDYKEFLIKKLNILF